MLKTLFFARDLQLALHLLVLGSKSVVLLAQGLANFHHSINLVFEKGEALQSCMLGMNLLFSHSSLSAFCAVAVTKDLEDIIAEGLHLVNRQGLLPVLKNET
jgi:hypothetical protein